MDFRIEARPYDDPDVQRLVDEVQQEYVRRYGGPDGAAVSAEEFIPPAGLFLVGLADGVAAAMGGWRFIAPDRVEIKRMYVVESARRRGLARRLLAELELTAAAAAARFIDLNTGPQQPEALALYESAGYVAVAGFGHYACTEDALFYSKRLDGVGAKQGAGVAVATRAVRRGGDEDVVRRGGDEDVVRRGGDED